MKIFLDINNKKVESENKSEPNYYLVRFKDIEVKDEFQEFSYKIVNNIEIKLNMKVKNKFNSAKVGNLFQKFQPTQNKKEEIAPKSVIGTGVNMKERLAMFSNVKKDNNIKNTASTKNVPKKLKLPANLMGIDSKSKFNNENKKEVINKEIKKENKEIKEKESEEKKESKEKLEKKENKENKENKEIIEKKESKENDKNINLKEYKKDNENIEKKEEIVKKVEIVNNNKEDEIIPKKENNEETNKNEIIQKQEIIENVPKEENKENIDKKEEIKEIPLEKNEEVKIEDVKEEKNEENIEKNNEENIEEEKIEEKKEETIEENNEEIKDENNEEKIEENNEENNEEKNEENNEEIKEEKNEEIKEEIMEEVKEEQNEEKIEENNEEKIGENNENNEEIKEEKAKDENQEEKKEEEEFYSEKEESNDESNDEEENDEVANININMEIGKLKSKEEDIKIKNPIGEEKKEVGKNFQKRPSNIFNNFINPLNAGKDTNNQSQKKQEVQKSSKILEKSSMFQKMFVKKSGVEVEHKEHNENQTIRNSNTNTNTNNANRIHLGKRNVDFLQRNVSLNLENLNQKSKKKKEEDFGLTPTSSNQSIEREDINDDGASYRTGSVSTEFSSCKSFVPEIVLDSITYDKYLEKLKVKGIKEHESKRESFCEGFFLTSFPYKNGQVIEKSSTIFPALCKHPDCSKLNAMKPEILLRYPLEDTKNLELNNLAATICFPTGIKVCYSQEKPPRGIRDYITNITNQKGERYYMMTYHFYVKMMNDEYSKKYEMHPLKHNLMKFGDAYLTYSEEEFTEEIVEKVQKTLEFCQDLGFREYVYVPFCICLISKYPYSSEMEKCLQSIFEILSNEKNEYNFNINDLIMYLINSVPIPEKNSLVKFYIPYWNKDISLKSTTINGLNILNIDFAKLTQIFSIPNIIIIFRLLLSEKKILFIDEDYTTLSKVTDAFISLLYPFKWVHTYIPIMSEQMLKYLESFLPFVNGINTSLMPLVKDIFSEGEIDESEEVFLIYIKENDIQIGSHLKKKKIKMNKYIQNNATALPSHVEKELKKKLERIKYNYESFMKNTKKKTNIDLNQLDFEFRDAFIDVFVYLLHDYQKYIGLLDDNEVIFNKNLFMQSVKKEEKTFYENLLDTQIFEQFTQNILNSDCIYFNKKIELFGKKPKNKEKMSIPSSQFILDRNYIVKPDFLMLEDDSTLYLEKTLTEKFKIESKTNENGIILPSQRIITNINPISTEKYDKSKCLIYLLPEKKETTQNKQEQETTQEDFRTEFLKKINAKQIFPMMMGDSHRKKTHLNTVVREGDLSDKKKELAKEEIKEWVIKIFKSEIEDYREKPKIKTDFLSLINNPFGIKCFVDLISHNNQKITMLQKNAFKLLGFILYNGLLFLLSCEETDQVLEESVLLFKSIKYFATVRDGKNITFMDYGKFKSNLMEYVKINQKNFWLKWYDIELKEKKDFKKKEYEDDDEDFDEDNALKEETLFSICANMIELEIPKTTVKNICDEINDKIFGKTTELGNKLSEKYIKKITSAKYASKNVKDNI